MDWFTEQECRMDRFSARRMRNDWFPEGEGEWFPGGS
jgi:hypothetical protein